MYFDINSTYRNRNDDPNPADFAVIPDQSHLCCGDSGDKRDICSMETTLTFDTPPVAFYENLVNRVGCHQ